MRNRLPETGKIAAAINLRMLQLEATGTSGLALANQMVGHMQDLKGIYDTASDRTLKDLCRRFPAFERYARLMEQVSHQVDAMTAAGTNPYAALPELPDPLKTSLMWLLRVAAELEREYQAAVDDGHGAHARRLIAMKQEWADDLRSVVVESESANLPLPSRSFVKQILKSTAEQIARLGE